MATIKENINKPEYKLLSGLVQGTVDELEDWSKKEARKLNTEVGSFVTRASFIKYENTLAELVRQIKEGQTFYASEKETWHDAPVTWADYPSQHKAYREKIYDLKTQYAKVVAEQKHLKDLKAEKERARRTAPRSTTPATEAKKSGWWKHVLGYGILGIALATAWFKGDKVQTPSGSSNSDKNVAPMEQRTSGMERRLDNASNAGTVVERGNTFVAESTQQTARRVMADAMNPSSTPIPADVHQGRITRQAQQLEEARYNTANAREAAATTGYLRQANDNVLGMARDEAYTGAYVSGENLQTARNLRAIRHETSNITALTDTLREVSEGFDTGSGLVKSMRHFGDSFRKGRHR